MATTERTVEFMRNFRLVHLDTHCDREDCHGTHVERIEWEIALRRTEQLGTIDVLAELDDEDRKLMLWVAYVIFVREQYSGVSCLIPPPNRNNSKVIIPKEVADAGLDRSALDTMCWLCDDPECRICNWYEGDRRVQRFVLRERGVLKRLAALNDERNMDEFLAELQERMESADV